MIDAQSLLPALRVLVNQRKPGEGARDIEPGSVIPFVEHEPQLWDLYDQPAVTTSTGNRWLRANFISTLDGSVIGADGRSGSINGDADLRVFQLLRAQADVILVGAGTARVEGYQDTDLPNALAQRRVNGSTPRLAVVTQSGNLPPALLAFEPLIITPEQSPALSRLDGKIPPQNLIAAGRGRVDFHAALTELSERGLHKILSEGGPDLFGSLLREDLVDELCLSWSPTIVSGPGKRISDGRQVDLQAKPHLLLLGENFLLGRWLLR